jgi:hypothetical protein
MIQSSLGQWWESSALARSDPTLLSKTDPGGLWLILERQVTLLQMAIAEG